MEDIEFYDGSWYLDAQYNLAPDEIKNLDRIALDVVYETAIAQKIFPTRQVHRGTRDYLFATNKQPSAPSTSRDFLGVEDFDKILKEETTVKLLGISKDFLISMVDIDASRNQVYKQSVDARHMKEMMALVGDYKERYLWRGGSVNFATGDIALTKGLLNWSGIQTFEAGKGADDKCGSAGDIPHSISAGIELLIRENFPKPFTVVMTPYLYGQALKNRNSTTDKSDLDLCFEMKEMGVIDEIYISKHLITSVNDGTNDAIVVIAKKDKSGNPTAEIIESYPQWHYPLPRGLGIAGKVLWMGGMAVYRPKSVALAEAITANGV